MSPSDKRKPTQRVRALKSGSVVRMYGRQSARKIGDDGATTPDVEISVSFDDRYMHRAQQSPEGTLEGSVKLKFADPAEKVPTAQQSADPASANPEPLILTQPVAKPERVTRPTPLRPTSPRPAKISPRPERRGAVKPPPPLPKPDLQRPQKTTRQRRSASRLGLAWLAVTAAVVLVPSRLDVGPGFELLTTKEEIVAAQVAPAGSTQSTPVEPEALSPSGPAQAAAQEIRVVEQGPDVTPDIDLQGSADVVVQQDPEPDPTRSSGTVSAPVAPAAEPNIQIATATVVREATQKLQPPRPQQLAQPSAAETARFVASKPVVTPPDPNTMALVPDNPFAGPFDGVAFNAEGATPDILAQVTPPPKVWRASTFVGSGQTDLPASPSPQAAPPPLQSGPRVVANLVQELTFEPQVLQPLSPLSRVIAQPKFAAVLPLNVSPQSGAVYQRGSETQTTPLIAAIALIPPVSPKVGVQDVLTAAPDKPVLVDLRDHFRQPPPASVNSDKSVNPRVATPPVPVLPKFGKGPVRILSQFWQTSFELGFEASQSGLKLATSSQLAPDWLAPGAELTAVNDVLVNTSTEYLTAINGVCADASRGAAELTMTVNTVTQTTQIMCERRSALSNGLVLEASYKRRKWRIEVVEEALLGRSELQVGDRLVLDYRRNVTLDTLQSINQSISAASDAGVETIEFGIVRNGIIENAVLGLIAE